MTDLEALRVQLERQANAGRATGSDYARAMSTPALSTMPKSNGWDAGARQTYHPPPDPISEHNSLLVAAAGKQVRRARRDPRGYWWA